jgi:hypothetical protein
LPALPRYLLMALITLSPLALPMPLAILPGHVFDVATPRHYFTLPPALASRFHYAAAAAAAVSLIFAAGWAFDAAFASFRYAAHAS